VDLIVADTGVGIPEADLPRMFERFHRVRDTRARTYEGTGIGLALVQELARLHGGAVSVASREGHGATFTVSIRKGSAHLPADHPSPAPHRGGAGAGAGGLAEGVRRGSPADADADDQLAGDLSDPVPSASDDLKGRVLVADDNADMRDYLRRILGHVYRVET